MLKFIKYHVESGEILSYGQCAVSEELNGFDNEAFIITTRHPDTVGKYVDLKNKSLCPKSQMPITVDKTEITADGNDTATITLPTLEPNGSEITVSLTIGRDRHVIGDGLLEFSTLEPGNHRLIFRAINYQDKIVEVTANAPEAS